MKDSYQIHSLDQLREVVTLSSQQNRKLNDRLYDYLDEHSKRFISESPVVFFATSDGAGHVDVSPKGDAPGFIDILDERTLLFPERMGNADARNLRNILENNHVSLLFVIPRTKDVLRVNGIAVITKAPSLLKRMISCGRPAQLCIEITVKECFFHCGRAFNRSHIWEPSKWPESARKYKINQFSQSVERSVDDCEEAYKRGLEQLGEADGAY